MAIILNIETATEISSVCIASGKNILSIKESEEPMVHTRETTQLIESCLKQAGLKIEQLEAVAVSSGPGSYTALRVGSSVAKGICYAQDIPLLAISTLQSLALGASTIDKGDFYCPMIDARRKEVYLEIYNNMMTSVSACTPQILTLEFIEELAEKGRIIFAGNGAIKFATMSTRPNFIFTNILCSSKHLVLLSAEAFERKNFADTAYFEPIYLKPPNITTSKKRL